MGQYRHTISNIIAMTDDVLMQKTTELNFHEGKRFHYFLDEPKHKSGARLNIVGHTSPVNRPLLFCGACEYAPGMNLGDFCRTVNELLTNLKSERHNVQCVRIIACYSGANGLAQALANYINMSVKGSLGGARMYPAMEFRPTSYINRYFIDKTDRDGHHFPEERDRQQRHDPAYGLYRWYYPQPQQPQSSDSDGDFDEFVNLRVPRK
ncbi:hypothetical protein Xbed_03389 [Xenorhabdus beddingii]|uniref:Uncharacterized protein n=1 Tax=Xenorhabdus beddingii TaxID=40578 RepID=A0A1Y2SGJ5_9GAMM|nr:hypothetical protein [Xenorhabdus beddingii]OTA16995.1 hypothetical protein Xbed_03389 [Xenorhabdus beddingii]